MRVVLIHAVREAMAPVRDAFSAHWPQCEIHDLLDSSLSADLAARDGVLTEGMVERFRLLARYAARPAPDERKADGILFTCSAFGPAIEAAAREVEIPVLKPNEAAFTEAIDCGARIALLVTFEPSLPPMLQELRQALAQRQVAEQPLGVVVPGAFAALKSGRAEEHDALIADAVARLPAMDAIVLGQFSMARAASDARRATGVPVLTTPESAVRRLRERLTGRAGG